VLATGICAGGVLIARLKCGTYVEIRMWHRILLILLLSLSSKAWAFEAALSAERRPGQNWEKAIEEELTARGLQIEPGSALDSTALGTFAIGGIPEWSHDLAALNALFFSARDIRLYDNPNSGGYRRKGAWYYPNDGCYAKAAHISHIAKERGHVRPGKIYAFGNLRLHTPYAMNGSAAYWSYHVAAAYHVDSTIYVVDPSVSGSGILTSAEWLSRISDNPAGVRVALCDSHSYSPYSKCRGGGGTGGYLGHMKEFLRLEWSNLRKLGYSPDLLLGPP
jgi:hypothetical protein